MEEGVQSHVIWSHKEHITSHNTDAEYQAAEFMNVLSQQRVQEMDKIYQEIIKTIFLPYH